MFTITFNTPLTKNKYTVTSSFHFAEEICKKVSNFYMANLDVDSLFANIPLDEIIELDLIVCIPLRSVRMFFVIYLT